ncbi:hypothetical protein EON68_04000, partial [archaeon]
MPPRHRICTPRLVVRVQETDELVQPFPHVLPHDAWDASDPVLFTLTSQTLTCQRFCRALHIGMITGGAFMCCLHPVVYARSETAAPLPIPDVATSLRDATPSARGPLQPPRRAFTSPTFLHKLGASTESVVSSGASMADDAHVPAVPEQRAMLSAFVRGGVAAALSCVALVTHVCTPATSVTDIVHAFTQAAQQPGPARALSASNSSPGGGRSSGVDGSGATLQASRGASDVSATDGALRVLVFENVDDCPSHVQLALADMVAVRGVTPAAAAMVTALADPAAPLRSTPTPGLGPRSRSMSSAALVAAAASASATAAGGVSVGGAVEASPRAAELGVASESDVDWERECMRTG